MEDIFPNFFHFLIDGSEPVLSLYVYLTTKANHSSLKRYGMEDVMLNSFFYRRHFSTNLRQM